MWVTGHLCAAIRRHHLWWQSKAARQCHCWERVSNLSIVFLCVYVFALFVAEMECPRHLSRGVQSVVWWHVKFLILKSSFWVILCQTCPQQLYVHLVQELNHSQLFREELQRLSFRDGGSFRFAHYRKLACVDGCKCLTFKISLVLYFKTSFCL